MSRVIVLNIGCVETCRRVRGKMVLPVLQLHRASGSPSLIWAMHLLWCIDHQMRHITEVSWLLCSATSGAHIRRAVYPRATVRLANARLRHAWRQTRKPVLSAVTMHNERNESILGGKSV
jgi:hypothetical protein